MRARPPLRRRKGLAVRDQPAERQRHCRRLTQEVLSQLLSGGPPLPMLGWRCVRAGGSYIGAVGREQLTDVREPILDSDLVRTHPEGAATVGFAPPSKRIRAEAQWPRATRGGAACNPAALACRWSRAMSSRIVERWPFQAAKCSAVVPSRAWLLFGAAPCSKSVRTLASSPAEHAS